MKLERKDQPIVIGVTGHVEKEFVTQGIEAGMNEVKSKPFYFKELKKVLDKYYSKSKLKEI